MRYLFAVILGFVTATTFAQSPTTPPIHQSVVQVMTYDSINGIYPVLRGRGSASLISSDGLLLTNNHVVTDETGKPQDLFIICVSKEENLPPSCNYVAHIVVRDEVKDIAVLKLSDTDLEGKKVNLSTLSPLELDYSYTPVSPDPTRAVGYPGIGGSTITQTAGVIAGTDTYNDALYIKTDTLIAPGNSGGPLIHNGKIIGVNTFLQGGFFEPSLGYALSIKDAKPLIDSAQNKDVSTETVSQKTIEHMKQLFLLNKQGKIIDDVFTISLESGYVFTNYVPNTRVEGKRINKDNYSVQDFSIGISRYLVLGDVKNVPEYILRKYYGYDPSFHTLKKTIIGGREFVQIISKSEELVNSGQFAAYLSVNADGSTIELIVSQAMENSSQTKEILSQKRAEFLSSLIFSPSSPTNVPRFTSFENPTFSFINSRAITNLIDLNNRYARYWQGANQSSIIIPVSTSSHEYISLNTYNRSLMDGVGKTIEEIYKIKTKKIPSSAKSLLTYRGHQGFAFCTPSLYSLDWTHVRLPDQNALTSQYSSAPMGLCRIELYAPDDTVILLDLYVEKKKLAKLQSQLLSALSQLDIASVGDGKTFIPQRILKNKALRFTNIFGQSAGFLEFLRAVDDDNRIPSSLVSLTHPLRYDEYAELYSLLAFKKKVSGSTFVTSLGIDPSAYVDQSRVNDLNKLLALRMAGGSLPDYSQKTVAEFLQGSSRFATQKEKVEAFIKSNTPENNSSFSDYLGDYIAFTDYYFSPSKGLLTITPYSPQKHFTLPSQFYPTLCSPTAKTSMCVPQSEYDTDQTYNVLTLGEALRATLW